VKQRSRHAVLESLTQADVNRHERAVRREIEELSAIRDAWCRQYPLSHTLDWTLEAVVESQTSIRGTIAGRFDYRAEGRAVEMQRIWTLTLTR
jgi:hypothetical protein